MSLKDCKEGVVVISRCSSCNKQVKTKYNKKLFPWYKRIYVFIFPSKDVLCASCSYTANI